MDKKIVEEQIDYWLKSARHDLRTAESLFENKHYDWCLFLGHLVIEKTLKAFFIRDTKKFPPKIHKLEVLATQTLLPLSPEDVDFLKEINSFNLEARYPDYKFKFYKLCTKKFSVTYFTKIKEFYRWLLKEMK